MPEKLRLMLSDQQNNLMARVIAEWDRQLVAQKVPKEALDSVRTYEAQLKPDKNYGVYVLCECDENGEPKPPFEAFVHINHAFPKTPKPTLRLTWSRIAPRYEWDEQPTINHGRIFSALVRNALILSQTHFKSGEIKIYMYTGADRTFGRNFVSNLSLTAVKLPFSVNMRGSWLHLNWL